MFIVNGVSGASLHCINFGVATEAVDGTGKVVGVATQHMGNAWNRNCVQAIKDVLEPLGFTVEHQAAAE